MSAELAGRSRCLVAHPINPPYLIPAVELVPAPWTDPQVVERTRERLAARRIALHSLLAARAAASA
jgi:3-hydroxyacyl-CoA dehydrogenase